jgi:hypothetical protein
LKRTLTSRNRVWLLYKNMPEALLRRHCAFIARYDALAILHAVARRDRHLIAGRVEALCRLPEFTEDRRKITTSARLHPDEMDEMLAPALSPRQVLKYRQRINRLVQPPSV